MQNQAPAEEYESTWEWGQYANPAFEAQVETIGKAKQYGIMSLEKCVDELYGDSMDKKEKAEEVARLKAENAETVPEPQVADDVLDMPPELTGGEANAAAV
jgi:hypothetical protein